MNKIFDYNNISDYIEISSFNESTSLVQRDNKIYVKKRVAKELTYIYKILLENKHKNVSNIIEVFEYEDTAIVIEEYINGETLAEILRKSPVQRERYTKTVIGQVCDGLTFLHKNNIIHRDINPNNIMVTNDGTVKIIDFDISRSVKKNFVSDTVILGTVGYAAPEQFGFSQSDTKTDLYAVGVLANVMLTGKMPNECLYGGKLGRVIAKATEIDARIRYKSISRFKHAFTNETDENTNLFIKILRYIPGFRTWEIWKMLIAIILYATYIPLMFVFVSWAANAKGVFLTVVSEIFMFVIPFVLLTNLCGVRRHLAHRPLAALAAALIISCVLFLLGACIFISNAANNI